MPETPNSPSVASPAVVVDPARPSNPATPAPKVPEFLASKLSQQDFEALPESARNLHWLLEHIGKWDVVS